MFSAFLHWTCYNLDSSLILTIYPHLSLLSVKKRKKRKEKETKHKPYPLKYYKFDTQDNNETWEMKLVIIIILGNGTHYS